MPWSPTTYRGDLITLRPPAESDVEDFLIRAGQPETTLAYGGDPSAIQPPSRASYKRSLARFPDSIKWVIDRNGHAIGRVRLHEIDEEEAHARLAIGIWHPADWGHSYGTEASRLVIGHAFNILNLHRVDLIVLESNQRAIRS